MSLTIDLWLALSGALAGLAGSYLGQGKGRLVIAAAIGAVVTVAMGFLRGLL
jgi:outer membrane lipoprotein SlyB